NLGLPPRRIAIHATHLEPVHHLIQGGVHLGAVILAAPLRRDPNRRSCIRPITRRELEPLARLRTNRRAVRRARQSTVKAEHNLRAIRRIRKPPHQPTHPPSGHEEATRHHPQRCDSQRTVPPRQDRSPTTRYTQPQYSPDSQETTARPHN